MTKKTKRPGQILQPTNNLDESNAKTDTIHGVAEKLMVFRCPQHVIRDEHVLIDLKSKLDVMGSSAVMDRSINLCELLAVADQRFFFENVFLFFHRLKSSECERMVDLRCDLNRLTPTIEPQIEPVVLEPRKEYEGKFTVMANSCKNALKDYVQSCEMSLFEASVEFLLSRASDSCVRVLMMKSAKGQSAMKMGNNLARMLRFVQCQYKPATWQQMVEQFDLHWKYSIESIATNTTDYMNWLVNQYVGEDPANKEEDVVKGDTIEEYGRLAIRVAQLIVPEWSVSNRAKEHDLVCVEASATLKLVVHTFEQQHGSSKFPTRLCLTLEQILELVAEKSTFQYGRNEAVGLATVILLSQTGLRSSSLLQKRTRRGEGDDFNKETEQDRVMCSLKSDRICIKHCDDGQVEVRIAISYSKVAGNIRRAPMSFKIIEHADQSFVLLALLTLLLDVGAVTAPDIQKWLNAKTGLLPITPDLSLWRAAHNGLKQGQSTSPSSLFLTVAGGMRVLGLPQSLFTSVSLRRGYAAKIVYGFAVKEDPETPLSTKKINEWLSCSQHWASNSASRYASFYHKEEVTGGLFGARTSGAFVRQFESERAVRKLCPLGSLRQNDSVRDAGSRRKSDEDIKKLYENIDLCDCHKEMRDKPLIDWETTTEQWLEGKLAFVLKGDRTRNDTERCANTKLVMVDEKTPAKKRKGATSRIYMEENEDDIAITTRPTRQTRRNLAATKRRRSETPEFDL